MNVYDEKRTPKKRQEKAAQLSVPPIHTYLPIQDPDKLSQQILERENGERG